jgi:histone H3/H4
MQEESFKDKMLPMSNTSAVTKKALPNGIIVSKDVKRIMNQAASIFVMYISTIASEIAKENQGKKKRAMVAPEHILQALEDMEFKNIAQKLRQMNLD